MKSLLFWLSFLSLFSDILGTVFNLDLTNPLHVQLISTRTPTLQLVDKLLVELSEDQSSGYQWYFQTRLENQVLDIESNEYSNSIGSNGGSQ